MWKVFIKVTYIVKDSWCVVIMVLPKEMIRKEGSASAHCVSFHGALRKLVRESIGWSVTKSFLRQDRIPSLTGPYIDSSARSHRWIRRSGNTQDFYDPSNQDQASSLPLRWEGVYSAHRSRYVVRHICKPYTVSRGNKLPRGGVYLPIFIMQICRNLKFTRVFEITRL